MADQIEHALCRTHARGIRYRVRGLDNFNLFARHGVAVACDDQPGQTPAPITLDRLSHCGRGFARTDDDHSAARRMRKVTRNTHRRLRGGDCRVKHPPQQRFSGHRLETATGDSRYNTDLSKLAISAGLRVTLMPHSSMTASFSVAVPLPPEIMAPACPMRLPGGAVTPAMKPTTGFFM